MQEQVGIGSRKVDMRLPGGRIALHDRGIVETRFGKTGDYFVAYLIGCYAYAGGYGSVKVRVATVALTILATVPRHPACMAAMARVSGS